MADGLQKVPACAIDLRERDEGSAQIVASALAQPERAEIAVELLRGFLGRPLRKVPGGHDEVERRRGSPVGPLESDLFPVREDPGEGGVDGDAPRNLRFRLLQREAVEGLERLVVLPPSEAGCFAVAEAGQGLERLQHASVLGDPRIRDQLFELLARVDRRYAPGRILVDLLWQDAALEYAR